MGWLLAMVLAALSFAVAAFVLKAPRGAWSALGAALLLGIAGYGLQGHPGLAGAPKPAPESLTGPQSAAMVEARRALDNKTGPAGNKWLVIGDGLARNGQYGDAASVLLGAVRHDPDNAEAWLAIANALVAHADGNLSPAATFAFERAEQAAPGHPGAPFFYGLALAQSGQLEQARAVWAGLLERTPADAPWRGELEKQLARLDAFMAGAAVGR